MAKKYTKKDIEQTQKEITAYFKGAIDATKAILKKAKELKEA